MRWLRILSSTQWNRSRYHAHEFSINHRAKIGPKTQGLVDGVLSGCRTSLSRAITLSMNAYSVDGHIDTYIILVESSNPNHQDQAEHLLNDILMNKPKGTKETLRIGIAGPPGAGKKNLVRRSIVHGI